MTQMIPPAAARAEYLARVHRVMDYVEQHIGERLTLETLAGIANFSPFHFHRVFTACTGEPLYQFILRLRLERAASRVAQQPGISLTAIALDCGFGSSAAFSRAFRTAFGMSASAWRQVSKKRQTVGKDRQDLEVPASYTASSAPAAVAGSTNLGGYDMSNPSVPVKEASAVRIETIAPMTIAYVRHTGPYAGNAALFGRLFGQLCQLAGPRGLLGPAPRFLTIYHDNPEITAQDKLRISVSVVVPSGTKAEGGLGVMTIEAGTYAVASYEIDPSEYGAAWNWLMGIWFPSSGYQPDDRPCFEMNLNDPEQHPQKKHIVEIWEPVRPL
jgi:AraC family transcriptional regulator